MPFNIVDNYKAKKSVRRRYNGLTSIRINLEKVLLLVLPLGKVEIFYFVLKSEFFEYECNFL